MDDVSWSMLLQNLIARWSARRIETARTSGAHIAYRSSNARNMHQGELRDAWWHFDGSIIMTLGIKRFTKGQNMVTQKMWDAPKRQTIVEARID